MEVKYHPLVQQDVLEAARKYQDIPPRLAKEFDTELRTTCMIQLIPYGCAKFRVSMFPGTAKAWGQEK